MTAPVVWMHQIVEQDEDPFMIPPRPVPAPTVAITYEPALLLPWTWRVFISTDGATEPAHIGHVNWDEASGGWNARTRGSLYQESARKCNFPDRHLAADWLRQKAGLAAYDRERRKAKRGRA